MAVNREPSGVDVINTIQESETPLAIPMRMTGMDGKEHTIYIDAKTGESLSNLSGYMIIDGENHYQVTSAADADRDGTTSPEETHQSMNPTQVADAGRGGSEFGGPRYNGTPTSKDSKYIDKPGFLGMASMVPGPLGMVAKGVNAAWNMNNIQAANNKKTALGQPTLGFKDTVKGVIKGVDEEGNTPTKSTSKSLASRITGLEPGWAARALDNVFAGKEPDDATDTSQVTNAVGKSLSPAAHNSFASLAPRDNVGQQLTANAMHTAPSPQAARAIQAGGLTPAAMAAMGFTSRTPAQISAISKTLAGELSPSSLKGLAANNPESVAELGNMVASIENRAASKMFGTLENALSPSQYNSLMSANMGVTNANYNKFASVLEDRVSAFYTGVTKPTSYHITNYVNTDIANPSWAAEMADPTQVGEHLFGALPEYGPDQAAEDSMASFGRMSGTSFQPGKTKDDNVGRYNPGTGTGYGGAAGQSSGAGYSPGGMNSPSGSGFSGSSRTSAAASASFGGSNSPRGMGSSTAGGSAFGGSNSPRGTGSSNAGGSSPSASGNNGGLGGPNSNNSGNSGGSSKAGGTKGGGGGYSSGASKGSTGGL